VGELERCQHLTLYDLIQRFTHHLFDQEPQEHGIQITVHSSITRRSLQRLGIQPVDYTVAGVSLTIERDPGREAARVIEQHSNRDLTFFAAGEPRQIPDDCGIEAHFPRVHQTEHGTPRSHHLGERSQVPESRVRGGSSRFLAPGKPAETLAIQDRIAPADDHYCARIQALLNPVAYRGVDVPELLGLQRRASKREGHERNEG
jgi:hypothetical protein